jgi:type I restriction enzyme, S subunit
MSDDFPFEWKLSRLEDSLDALIDYRGKTPTKTTFGIPLVTAKIVKGGRIEEPQEFIAEAEFDEWMRRGMPLPGDVVMTTEAPLGEIAQLDNRKVALAQRVITLRGKAGYLDNTFLRFLMQSAFVQDQLEGRASGTTVMGIRQSELRGVMLVIPPLDEQRAIARLLGALDDKIELNRRMNRTLEELAAALFRSWFVDFDPVVAKAAGRPPPQLRPKLAALFPAHFQDSELGDIPKDWRVAKLSAVASVNSRKLPRNYPHAEIEYLDISSVSEGVINGTTRLARTSAPSRAQRLVAHGDTIWSCVRPNRRSFALIQDPPENMVVSTGFATLTPTCKSAAFIYTATTTEEFTDYLTAHAEGSAYPAVRPDSFENAPLVIPPPEVLTEFEKIVAPWLAQVAHNIRESRTLAALRDTLLPKLLSGEVRVKAAEKIVEAKT